MKLKTVLLGGLCAVGAAVSGSVVAQEAGTADDAILILDASGSMWGQIDGVNKIVIAKDVVEGLVRSLPEEQRLGFVAYGHRREGDCSDIETLADVGADRDVVIDALRSLTARGKTPLTQSIMHAATELDYEHNAASVILVSDGLENCEADPCELARTLEENGLDFTIHVVGFDVTEEERAGLVCIAEETGGEFVAADNADELAQALTQIADVGGEAEPSEGGGTPVPSTLALKATILQGGPLIQSQLDWAVTPAAGGDPVFTASDVGVADTEILPGDYVVDVAWSGWRDGSDIRTGHAEFSVAAQQPKVLTIPIDLGLPVTLEAPSETAEAVGFDVTWSGPDDLGAYVQVSSLEDGPRTAIYFFEAARSRDAYARGKDVADIDTNGDGVFDANDLATMALGAPSRPGEYEVRYVLADPRIILARSTLTVTDSEYTVSAPGEVIAGSVVDVEWDGPLTDGDFVTMIEAGSETVFQNGRTDRLVEGEVAQLTAPPVPGDYEIRYILANGYTTYPDTQQVVQTSVPITVIAAEASVSGPAEAVGGSTIEVEWTGPEPGWENDVITITEAGSSAINRMSNARLFVRGGGQANPVEIRVPAIEGDYEIVYFLQPGPEPIARQPITITRAQATVDAPDTVRVGESFTVQYSGDGFSGDRVVVVAADRPDNSMWNVTPRYGFFAEAGGSEGTVTDYPISSGPGEYEARYVTGLENQVLARDRFTVVE